MYFSKGSFVAVTALICALAAFAQAQQPEPLRITSPARRSQAEPPAQAQQTQTAQGELLDVDARASTLSVKTQTVEMTFRFTDETKVTGAQKGVSGLATMTGSQVVVMYQKEGASNIATNIEVRAQK